MTPNPTRTLLVIGAAMLACGRVNPKPMTQGADIRGDKLVPNIVGAANALQPEVTAHQGVRAARSRLTEPYPRARWRLAQSDDLARVVLWVSHVLIRHRDVRAGVLSFEQPLWTSAPEAPDRTREAAFALARDLASRAGQEPDRFEDLARDASEDVATRDAGGSLGAYTASRFSAWPQVLDAIAALEPGQTSRVVETEFGFHVFKRRPPPPEMLVSASRIIIGHDDASWLSQYLARSTVPQRSRAEALALANQIYQRALAAPSEFPQLVQEYSEHRDAVRDGDFGEWSTREPTAFRRAIEIGSQLEVGEIAPPVDSLFGYQIIQRTANRPRVVYSMQSISLPFEANVPEKDARSRASVRSTASSIADAVHSEPSRFGDFQRKYGDPQPSSWIEGREDPRIERVLSRLEPGEISKDVVEHEGSFCIVKRLEAEALPAMRVEFELPTPERADVEYLVVRSNWLRSLDSARQAAEPLLKLDEDPARRFSTLHDIKASMQAARSETERVEVYRELQRQVMELLGPDAYERYASIVELHFRDRLTGDSAPL
jgi:hypothetical protein